MNRYESIILDKMVGANNRLRDAIILNLTDEKRENESLRLRALGVEVSNGNV